MARQSKELPTRKLRDDRLADGESLLLRSAESLGRVIGELQRQLDGATKRLSYRYGNGEVSPAKARTKTRLARKSTATKRTRAAATKRKTAKKR